MRGLYALAAALALMANPATAQDASGANLRRTPDGHPDFQGVWDGSWGLTLEASVSGEKLEITEADVTQIIAARHTRIAGLAYPVDPLADELASLPLPRIGGHLRSRQVIAPSEGVLPYTADAKKAVAVWRASGVALGLSPADGPEARPLSERCIVVNGHAPLTFMNAPFGIRQIVQTGDFVVIHSEAGGDARIISMVGPSTVDAPRSRLGRSLGRWEGDTLVVETDRFPESGFTIGLVNQPPIQVGRDSKVIERFTAMSPNEILYQFSIEDPSIYSGPWLAEYPMERSQARPMEYACHEGNYSLGNTLLGARVSEQRAAEPKH